MQTQAKGPSRPAKSLNQREMAHLEKVLEVGRRIQTLRSGLEMFEELHAKRRAQFLMDIEAAQHEFDLLQEDAS